MLGNITVGIRPAIELSKIEEKKGGPDKLSCSDIFDTKKYLEKMKEEMADYKFVETFVDSQAFAVFVEELYLTIRKREQSRLPTANETQH